MLAPFCPLRLAPDSRELARHGTLPFPCVAYHSSLRQYAAHEVPTHWHPEFEVFLVEQGSVCASLGGQNCVLHAGEGYFCNAGALHGLRQNGNADCVYASLVFDGSIVGGTVGSIFDESTVRPLAAAAQLPAMALRNDVDWQSAVLQQLRLAYTACAEEAPGFEFATRHALSQILFALRHHLPVQARQSRLYAQDTARMKQMLAYLHAHYADPVTAAQLAASAHICVRECQRCFEKLLHTTPGAYLLRYRIGAAAELLDGSALSVTEICLRTGFASPSYFTKQFTQLMGCTPTAYRNRPA